MKIILLDTEDCVPWNSFVVENFPPVGAFLQSYEWGNFKEALHGKVLRFALVDSNAQKDDSSEWLGCFQLEIHSLPFGFSYGYAPRGPVLQKNLWNDAVKIEKIFTYIGEYFKKEFSHLIFIRFEPPFKEHFKVYDTPPFIHPTQYLQPRFNQLVTLAPAEELLSTFSSDIKHDIRAGERIGTTVTIIGDLSPEQWESFEGMKKDTGSRSGKSIFPSDEYFKHFVKNFDATSQEESDPKHLRPRLCFFIASNKQGVPVAINLNLLFGTTLTYLYGASCSGPISKRAPGYLHWKSMEYGYANGFTYYDLGGVDDELWHGLTYFKRQFGGETLEYTGTIEAVLRPKLYKLYKKAKELR